MKIFSIFSHTQIMLMYPSMYTSELRQFLVCIFLGKNTTFCNNVVNCRLNVTKFGMLIDNIVIHMSHDFGCYGNHFGGKL